MSQAVQNASRFKGRLVVVLVDGVIARAIPRVDWIVTKMIRKLIGGEWCGGLCQIPTIDAGVQSNVHSSGRCAVIGAMCSHRGHVPNAIKGPHSDGSSFLIPHPHHEPCFQKTHGLLDHWHAVSMANENHLETRFSV